MSVFVIIFFLQHVSKIGKNFAADHVFFASINRGGEGNQIDFFFCFFEFENNIMYYVNY